jgi:hypothetical protein
MGEEYTGTNNASGGDLNAEENLIQIRQQVCQRWNSIQKGSAAATAKNNGQKPGVQESAQKTRQGSSGTGLATQL